ncbi:pyridoxamine 5'-phosphate oxidase family protein [Oceaniglobus trochenteri]|uniref:pyridoxamine 5'-phosphate oxidase family protein n=1 Tax=Oceaniglobus trochenteri TaxID=2763260 RepID=UPI001CFFF569|nr:pyridoxamine 5'-phosphate oxidase family protein [Oceaniglobus trochenteri]
MAKQFPALSDAHRDFIARQHMFFTATATTDSRVNISPREIGALRVVDAQTVLYLDRTGSGMETAAHLRADGRMTIMLCSFAGPPQIMRLYGQGTALSHGTAAFDSAIAAHFDAPLPLGTRQIVRLAIDLVQTSCGYGVPLFDYQGERQAMENWHDNKGEEGIRDWWDKENRESIDGLPTGFPAL